eukprot:m.711859 g.711859  ORF g.711859 m.711859 type:complete len:646 (+) comp22955_c0_seq3:586-2523(+)
MASTIPPSFICPIFQDIMVDPVSTADGHSYERLAIERWLRDKDTSPITGEVLSHKNLTTNVTLRKAIEEWEESHFGLIRRCDLIVESPPVWAGSFKTVSRGVLKRNPGTTALLATPRPVAVLEMCDGTELRAEAKVLVQWTRHPHLVRYMGMCKEFREGGGACLVTELAAQGSLSDAMENIQGLISAGHDVAMLQQVCSGMLALTSAGFMHRDLALRNVQLFAFHPVHVDETVVKVADFGLTVGTYGGTHRTVSQGVRPIRWMSPEALKCNKFSEKSDVWAFGVTCIEIFSRAETPYRGWLNSYVVEQVLSGYRLHQPLRCPSAVYAALIRPCFATSPADRPPFADLVDVCAHIEGTDGLVAWSGSVSVQGTAVVNPEVARAIACLGSLLDPAVVASIVQRAGRDSFKLDNSSIDSSYHSVGTDAQPLAAAVAASLRATQYTDSTSSAGSGRGTLSSTAEETEAVQYVTVEEHLRTTPGHGGGRRRGKRTCIYAPLTHTPEGSIRTIEFPQAPGPTVVQGDDTTLAEVIYDGAAVTAAGPVHVLPPQQPGDTAPGVRAEWLEMVPQQWSCVCVHSSLCVVFGLIAMPSQGSCAGLLVRCVKICRYVLAVYCRDCTGGTIPLILAQTTMHHGQDIGPHKCQILAPL